MPKKHTDVDGSRANALLTLVLKGTGSGKKELSLECRAQCLELLKKAERLVLLKVFSDQAAELSLHAIQDAINKSKGTQQ